jgi:hypothetical protein
MTSSLTTKSAKPSSGRASSSASSFTSFTVTGSGLKTGSELLTSRFSMLPWLMAWHS